MGKVLSFGELLLRICPDTEGEWLTNNQLPFYVGGAELNVATALALWDIPSAYFTALPQNAMADQLLSYMQARQIDTRSIHRSGERIGLYYLPKGKDLKNAGVIYDRAHSAFAQLQTGTIDWDTVLEGISWFHFSAICPALNQAAADVCLEALQAAAKRNITISVDLNYRAKLWQYGKQPVEIMPQLVNYAHLVMGNIWAAEKMLGIHLPEDFPATPDKALALLQAENTSRQVLEQYPNCQSVANTFRFDAGAAINYYTTLFIENKLYASKAFQANSIVDKVGSGDCYMAGLIYGCYQAHQPQQIVDFATAAAFNKLFIASDATDATVAQIAQTLASHEN